eukprot:TRINITY_DN22056_c0_g1_i2.p1 TRINITY_DN22056_c0_g1~~TRINITY_DN22056_c0_g1_i2.p1  ORF type:complete len:369 (-),score=83.26 TRINITY_DN22056_c0_g1_i2:111-1217(-)
MPPRVKKKPATVARRRKTESRSSTSLDAWADDADIPTEATVTAEYVRGERRFSSFIAVPSLGRRLLAPARATQEKSEADHELLLCLAHCGFAGEQLASRWRNGECSDRETCREAAALKSAALKAAAKAKAKVPQIVGKPLPALCEKRWRLRGKQSRVHLTSPRSLVRRDVFKAASSNAVTRTPQMKEEKRPSSVLTPTPLAAQRRHQEQVAVAPSPPKYPRKVAKASIVTSSARSRPCDEFIRTKVYEALVSRMPELTVDLGTLKALSHDIAVEFSDARMEKARQQLRALLFNLRDTRNPDFIREVVSRSIPVEQLPQMASEDMASAEKRAERLAAQAEATREITLLGGISSAIDKSALSGWKALKSR